MKNIFLKTAVFLIFNISCLYSCWIERDESDDARHARKDSIDIAKERRRAVLREAWQPKDLNPNPRKNSNSSDTNGDDDLLKANK